MDTAGGWGCAHGAGWFAYRRWAGGRSRPGQQGPRMSRLTTGLLLQVSVP